MKVLVAASHEANNLIPVDEVGHKFTVLNTAIDYDLVEGLVSFSNEIDWGIPNAQRGEREVLEFYPFVHQIHSCVEAGLNIILDIASSNLNLVHEWWKLSARACSENRGVQVIVVKTKPDITWGDSLCVDANLQRRVALLRMLTRGKELLQVVFGGAHTVLSNDHVRL